MPAVPGAPRRAMPVSELLIALREATVTGAPPAEVTGVAADSRAVQPGDCFVAVPGLRQDARRFVPEAVRRGATLVISEGAPVTGVAAAQIVVPSARLALARAAAAYYRFPSRAPHRGRNHRNKRQDDHVLSRGSALARTGPRSGCHRHHRLSLRR